MARLFVQGTKARRAPAKPGSRTAKPPSDSLNGSAAIDDGEGQVASQRTVTPTLVDDSEEDVQQPESTTIHELVEDSDDEVVLLPGPPKTPAHGSALPSGAGANSQETMGQWGRLFPKKAQANSAPKQKAAKEAAKKDSKTSKVQKGSGTRRKKGAESSLAHLEAPIPSGGDELETPGAGPSSAVPKAPPQTPRPPKAPSKASIEAKDKEYQYRSCLFKTEVIKWPKYNLGTSDLVAIPALVRKNAHHKDAKDTQCYRVLHLNWLQEEINAGHGLFLPEGSVPNEEAPNFIRQNGESIPKAEARKRFRNDGLLSKQLDRLKPCKLDYANEEGVGQRVNHWNIVDVEALLQQGANLKESCPAVSDICHFEKTVTREAALKFHGIDESELSQIEACRIETDDRSGIVTHAEYNLWDILQLKASLEANEPFNNLITETQAIEDFKVSYPQLKEIGVACILENTPHKDSFVAYYRVSDLEALVGPRPEGELSAAGEDEPQSNIENFA